MTCDNLDDIPSPWCGVRVRKSWSGSKEANGVYIKKKLSGVRRMEPITMGINFFNNPCPFATIGRW